MSGPYLPPGDELDRIVDEGLWKQPGFHHPHYSQSYEDFGALVAKLEPEWFITISRTAQKDFPWWAEINRSHGPQEMGEPDDEEFTGVGLTMPHALCLAAAKAYGWEG